MSEKKTTGRPQCLTCGGRYMNLTKDKKAWTCRGCGRSIPAENSSNEKKEAEKPKREYIFVRYSNGLIVPYPKPTPEEAERLLAEFRRMYPSLADAVDKLNEHENPAAFRCAATFCGSNDAGSCSLDKNYYENCKRVYTDIVSGKQTTPPENKENSFYRGDPRRG